MNRKPFGWKIMAAAIGMACSSLCFAPAASANWQPALRVGIVQGASSASLQVQGTAAVLRQEGEKKALRRLPVGSTLIVTAKGSEFLVDGKAIGNKMLRVESENPTEMENLRLSIEGHTYRGAFLLQMKGGAITAVNEVQTEDYLAGVVPEEMPADWPAAALEAQAIAARTFALKNRKRHASEGFDLCATTHCQAYGGTGAEKAASTRAVKATKGEVMLYNGALVDALFHTDSGGMTENSENVWGTYVPYLKAATEAQTETQPWKKEVHEKTLTSLLAKEGKPIGDLKKIELSPLRVGKGAMDRSASGRVKTVRFVGSKGTVTLSGNMLRSLLGLRSTLFQMRLAGDTVQIDGYGWGHGLGLSQWGARAWAAKGWSSAEILQHYYKGITLKKLY